MPTAVLTGCNSGIGNEIAKIALASNWKVYALDIVLGDKIKDLSKGGSCTIAQVDVTNPDSIKNFKAAILPKDEPIDLIFNIAGIMPDPTTHDTLHTLTLSTLEKCFAINASGPFLLTQALLPNLLLPSATQKRISVISSRVGSIADNTSGGQYAYRASKTAVNSLFKTLAVELKDKNVAVTILHPGITRTNLSPMLKDFQGAEEPHVVAEGLWKLVMEKGVAENGKFWHREGYELPW